jgi:rhodanese-related sulfurtransferase
LARGAYRVLYQAGYRNMMILDEGIPGWHAKHYPVDGALAGKSPTKG